MWYGTSAASRMPSRAKIPVDAEFRLSGQDWLLMAEQNPCGEVFVIPGQYAIPGFFV